MSRLEVIYFCILLSQTAYTYNKLSNYSLYEVTAFNPRERALLYYLYTKNEKIVFMNGITNEAAIPMDVLVDRCCTSFFEDKLRDNDIEFIKKQKDKL